MNKFVKVRISKGSLLFLIGLVMSALIALESLISGGNVLSTEAEVIEEKGVRVQVVDVVDGDTVRIVHNTSKKVVRLIGIDSPETVHPQKKVECFGKEASDKLLELIDDRWVYIHADNSQGDVDRYGRLLRYIFLENGTHINEHMISEGYAVEYTYDEPYMYQSSFKKAQKNAQDSKKGLWADNACAPSVDVVL